MVSTNSKIDGIAVVRALQQRVVQSIDPKNPMWVDLDAGKYTKVQLKEWIKQEYHCRNYIMKGVYYILSNALHMSDPPVYDEELRIAIMGTMIEEEGKNNFGLGDEVSHPMLLLRFAEAIGLTKEEMHAARILPCTRAWMEVFTYHCHKSLVEGMSANGITSERHNTIVFPRVIEALKKNYGLKDELLLFFSEHSDPDVEIKHSEEAAALLANRILTEYDALTAEWAVDHTLYAIQNWYRGIHKHLMSGEIA